DGVPRIVDLDLDQLAHAPPTTVRTASATSSADGARVSASGTGVGTFTKAGVTGPGGAARSARQCSAASAQISDANEYGDVASCATTSRPVLRIDARIVSASSGCRLRGSTTSTEGPPSSARRSAAASALSTMRPVATTV